MFGIFSNLNNVLIMYSTLIILWFIVFVTIFVIVKNYLEK